MAASNYTTGGGMMQGVQALFPALRPRGYFTRENVGFIQKKIGTVLQEEFGNFIHVSAEDVLRTMQRVVEERVESIPRMNERVVMEITRLYREHIIELNRNLKWEENMFLATTLFDPTTGRSSIDPRIAKTRDSLAKPRVGGSLNFFFT